MKSVVEDLVKRLGAATEGNPELDARIQAWEHGEEFDKLDPRPRGSSHTYDPLSVCWLAKNGRRYTCWGNKAYTRSLDAAITLLPDGFWWTVHQSGGATGSGKDFFTVRLTHSDPNIDGKGWGVHQKAYIAVCIAALRARLALEQESDKE